MRARYYDPSTAQFLNRDPIEAVTRSPYGYVDGDPLNASDPSGLCWWFGCALGRTAVGQAINNAAGGILHGVTFGLADSWLDAHGVDRCTQAYTIGIIGSIFTPGGGEKAVAEQGLVRVGRWMSAAEHEKMLSTGLVQESIRSNGNTSVVFPAGAERYMNSAKSGSR